MIVGFTGTREGLTCEQKVALEHWLLAPPAAISEAHHGCCVGADTCFAAALYLTRQARVVLWERCVIHGHPSDLTSLTDPYALKRSNVVHPALPPPDRNRAIVDACDVLLACPKGPEETRSGTWSTIRWARKAGKPVVIFQPDGTVLQPTPKGD
jgi:hypothetical protein